MVAYSIRSLSFFGFVAMKALLLIIAFCLRGYFSINLLRRVSQYKSKTESMFNDSLRGDAFEF